ncbi:hypothetical protein ABEB36_003840 [Hypothenemus hampei]|uniref:MOFRL-associated domain-containing protein n=1 Tax=Hypothenemus hampei TaxID=57062 RepID=A0ABD1F2L4_HYPHA
MYGRTLNFCVLRRGFPEDFSGSALKYFSKIMASASSNEQSTIKLRNIFAEAIKSVQPSSLIGKQIKCIDGHLYVNNVSFPAKTYYAVGFGKAVLGMATELDRVLGDNLERAILTIPKGIFEKHPEYSIKNSKILCFEGAENNIPDEAAMKGAIKIKELAESLDINDLLIVLISGGGSALLPLPIPPVSLEEKQQIVRSLSRGGASIQELNIVRKHLSLLKGEPTVKVSGSGKGGRNQHLALSFSLKLDTLQETEGETENFGNIFLLAAGTDGIDGPTDAAGAIGSSELTSTCAISNLNPKQYLINSNSNMFFSLYENGDNLIKIGHTGTNVMDLHFLFIEPRKQTK